VNYIVIVPTEGGCSVYELPEHELLKRLNESYWGNVKWLDAIPKDSSVQYWKGPGAIIVRGKVVVPKPVTTVKEYQL
jgi:hypothetical protein